ncbi:MAG: hypothetical protein MR004_00080 [Clostridiales bacterium]|nr:hypothetical protein [Clostridiales bacterium]MDY4036182.1 hypothetical protein [Candidatus Pseudoscilispira sp.]
MITECGSPETAGRFLLCGMLRWDVARVAGTFAQGAGSDFKKAVQLLVFFFIKKPPAPPAVRAIQNFRPLLQKEKRTPVGCSFQKRLDQPI